MKKIFYPYTLSIGTIMILLFLTRCDSTTTNESSNSPDIETKQASASSAKSDQEVIVDGAIEVAGDIITLAKKGMDNRRYRDSVRIANKEEMWVYEIGFPFNDINTVNEELVKLKSIEGISVFENNGDYSIVRSGDSQKQLWDSLDNFKSEVKKIDAHLTKINVTNLSLKCSAKNNLKQGKIKKINKKHPEIPCCMCD